MTSLLSDLFNVVAEGIHKFRYTLGHNDKKCESCRNKYKPCNCFSLLQKCVYPCEYMDDLEKFNKTLLSKKKRSYSHLNTKAITDADYAHAKRVCKDYRIKHLGKHHDLYVQSNTLLLADVL